MTFKANRTSLYPDYPDNDDDRLDIIFQFFFDQNPNYHLSLFSVIPNSLQWTVEQSEITRIENLLLTSGLFTPHKQPLFTMLELNADGRYFLGKYGSYSKYKKHLDEVSEEDKRHNEVKKTGEWYQTQNAKDVFDNFPRTKKLAEDADRIGKKSLCVARWSMGIAALSLAILVIIELLKHYKIWPFE